MKSKAAIILTVIIYTLFMMSPCVAIKGKTVNDVYIDVDVDIKEDDVSKIKLCFIINNTGQNEIYITGIDYYVVYGDDVESTSSHGELRSRHYIKIIEPNQSTIFWRVSVPIAMGTPMERFLRRGFINVTVNGSVFINKDNNSFEFPFEKFTTLYLKIEGAKQATCPNVTRIELKTDRLVNHGGNITDIFVDINVTITNYNPTAVIIGDYRHSLYIKKNGKWMYLDSSQILTGLTIEAKDTYTIHQEHRISDEEIIQYIMRGSPTDIKVKGSIFMFPKEKGWTPTYFELPFVTVITITNGSGMTGKFSQLSIPSLTPGMTLSGYKWYYDETGYLIAYPDDWKIIGAVFIVDNTTNIESCVMFDELGTPASVMVTVESVNLKDLEELKKERLKKLRRLAAVVLEENEIMVNDRKGYEVIYRVFGFIKQRSVSFIANGRSYTIVCSTSEKLYDEYKDTFDKIINSFRIPTESTSTPDFVMLSAVASVLAAVYLLRRKE